MRPITLFVLPLAVLAVQPPQSPIQFPEARYEVVPYIIDDKCAPDQYKAMLSAAKNARRMAKVALKEWWDEGKHGEVAATYLGIPDDGKYKDNKYAQLVYENLRRVTLLSEAVPLGSKYIFVSCKDQWEKCGQPIEGWERFIAAYAENTMQIDGHHYDIVLCKPWYNADSPSERYDNFKDRPKEEIAMDWLENDAGKFLHEMMHINMITEDRPHIKDQKYQGARAYTSKVIAEWVRQKGTKTSDVVGNADSYTQFVNAIHFKKKFGFLPPPERDVPLKEIPECYGRSGSYVDEDFADYYAKDFCEKLADNYEQGSDGEYAYQYAEDKPDHIEFKVVWKSSGAWSAGDIEDKCWDSLSKAIWDCDGSGRWKYGGGCTFKKQDEEIYVFYFTPKHDRPDPIPEELPGQCDVYYKITHDEFYIYGGLWAGSDHGQNQLLPNLRRCGVVSSWEFEYYDEWKTGGWEWKASGSLPIGAQQWGCVSDAVKDSHGPSITCGGQ